MKNFIRTFKAVLTILVVASLAACGGGGGNGTPTGVAVSKGVITEKGSIFVNGIEYSTTGATIKVDGITVLNDDALKVGMIVKVRGTADDNTKAGVATLVEARDALEATIDDNGVDPVNKTIIVMGQLVKIEDNITRLNDDDNVKVFAGANFQPGDRVEIHGFPDDNGGLRATRVVKKPGVAEDFEIKGFVNNLVLPTTAAPVGSFGLSLLPGGVVAFTVNFTAAQLPAGTINGSLVEVKSAAKPVAGVLTASSIELEDKLGAAGEKVEVEGIVTSVDADITTLVINGQTVLIDAATVFEGGVKADIAAGVKLEAEGPLNANNAIVATKISFRSNVKIEGDASLTSATGLTLLGKQISIIGTTRLDDGLPADNDHVEVRAILARDGNLVATRVKKLSASDRAFLQGPVTAFNGATGTMTIVDIPIATDLSANGTEFEVSTDSVEQAVGAAAFFARLTLNVTVVKVRWDSFTATTVAVDEAEIEED